MFLLFVVCRSVLACWCYDCLLYVLCCCWLSFVFFLFVIACCVLVGWCGLLVVGLCCCLSLLIDVRGLSLVVGGWLFLVVVCGVCLLLVFVVVISCLSLFVLVVATCLSLMFVVFFL